MRLKDEEFLAMADSLNALLKTGIPRHHTYTRLRVGEIAQKLREHATSSSKASWSDTEEVKQRG